MRPLATFVPGISLSMTMLLFAAFLTSGCSTAPYYSIAEMPLKESEVSVISLPLAIRVANRESDEVIVQSPTLKYLIFHSDKTLKSGAGSSAELREKEKLVVEERNGAVFARVWTYQVVKQYFWEPNISGHGRGGWGFGQRRHCEGWGTMGGINGCP